MKELSLFKIGDVSEDFSPFEDRFLVCHKRELGKFSTRWRLDSIRQAGFTNMTPKTDDFELITPDLGDTDKIELVRWNAKQGETIEIGQEVCELVTDKASFPMESPIHGTLTQILKEKGSIVSKGEILGVIRREKTE